MIRAIGIDAALANMGLVAVDIEPTTGDVKLVATLLVQTEKEAGKTVRKASDDLRRAHLLSSALRAFCFEHGAVVAFAEVPSGAQSATAARALGIAVGVIGSCPVPVFEVSQQEVKKAVAGSKTATKRQIIEWAVKKWPGQKFWKINKATGQPTNDNEHLADACGVVMAGIKFNTAYAATAVMLTSVATTRSRVRVL